MEREKQERKRRYKGKERKEKEETVREYWVNGTEAEIEVKKIEWKQSIEQRKKRLKRRTYKEERVHKYIKNKEGGEKLDKQVKKGLGKVMKERNELVMITGQL